MLRYVKNIVYFYFLLLLIYFCNLEFKLKFWKVLWWIYMYIVLFMDEYCSIENSWCRVIEEIDGIIKLL